MAILLLWLFGAHAMRAADETLDFRSGYRDISQPTEIKGKEFSVLFGTIGTEITYYISDHSFHVLNGGIITVKATNGRNISEIKFGFSDTSFAPTSSDYRVDTGAYDIATSTWTGMAGAVTLARADVTGHWKLQYISVTFDSSTALIDPALAFTQSAATAQMGTDFSLPALQNPYQLSPITYASSNNQVAEVDASTGKVTLAGPGSTDITARFAGDETYNAGTATCHLQVLPQDLAAQTYELVTDASTLKPGDIVTFVYSQGGKALGAAGASNFGSTDITMADNRFTATDAVTTLTLGGSAGAWTFRLDNGSYLCTASSSANYLKTSTSCGNENRARISISSGDASIEFQGAYSHNKLSFNTTYNIFSCYLTAESPVQIYRKVTGEAAPDVTLRVSAAGYATLYYGAQALVVPAGTEVATYRLSNGQIEEGRTYAAGAVIPAGEAVVVKARAGDYTFRPASSQATADADNVLHGTDASEQLPADASCYFYKLSLNSEGDLSSTGFYWAAPNGAAFTNGAHKAYLKLPVAQQSKSCYLFDEPTAIHIIQENVHKLAARYNLSGQQVDENYHGFVIQNGRKFFAK